MAVKVNKSEKIRGLFDAGLSIAEISKVMGIRYQFAHNVISYYVAQKTQGVVEHGTRILNASRISS